MSRADVNVIKDMPKMPNLTMNRSSSHEDLHSPPLNVEGRAMGRNSTLSSAKTDLNSMPVQRLPSESESKPHPHTQKNKYIQSINRQQAHLGWDTITYSTLGKPPLGKQTLKKSVASVNADYPIDVFEDSATIMREEENLDEELVATKSLFNTRNHSWSE